MNCKEAMKRLHSFTDRELSEAEMAEVHLHLAKCHNCRKHFEFLAEFKRLVRRQAPREPAPAHLRERVLARFREAHHPA